MKISSGRNASITTGEDFGPFLTTIIAACLFFFGFPAWLLGFLMQRCLQHFLPWRWHFWIWLILSGLAVFALVLLYQFGLHELISRELTAYVVAGTQNQLDFLHWPWEALWTNTWPVWEYTLVGIPIAALAQELVANTQGSRAARQLHETERIRKQRIASTLQRTRVQASFSKEPSSHPVDVILGHRDSESDGEAHGQAPSLPQWYAREREKKEAEERQREEQAREVWRERYAGLLEQTYELLRILSTLYNESLAERVACTILAERAQMRGDQATRNSIQGGEETSN